MLIRVTHMTILPIVCHMPESILWLLLHICWQTTRMSGLPIRAKYKHFKIICEHTCDSSPTDSSSSCLNWWSSKQRLETLKNCSTFLFAKSQHRSTHFRACPSISQDKLHIGYNRCPSNESWQLSKYEPRTTKLTQEPNQCHVTRTNIEKAEHHDSQAEKLARLTGGPHYAPLLRPDQCMLCRHIGHRSSECSNKVGLLSPGNLRSGLCGVWCHVLRCWQRWMWGVASYSQTLRVSSCAVGIIPVYHRKTNKV